MAEQKWFEGLRRQIKHRCGPGWGIDERHGGVRLTRRIAAYQAQTLPFVDFRANAWPFCRGLVHLVEARYQANSTGLRAT